MTVAETPEFFANGVLVHNCYDALRYGLMRGAQKRQDTQYERGRDPYAFVG